MKTKNLLKKFFITSFCWPLAMNALADKTNFEFNADAGALYDSNVNVEELDTSIGSADTARIINARLGVQLKPTDKFTLKAAYRYSDKHYQQFTDFNQSVHSFSAEASYTFDYFTVGSNLLQARADLAAEPFLQLSQRSVFIGKLINQGVYLRGAINQQEKRFNLTTDRNAQAKGLDADAYFFFNGGKGFVAAGISREQEDARLTQYDNTTLTYRTRLSNQFNWFGKENTVQVFWRCLNRDYSAITPAIATRREDLRRTAGASWEFAFNRNFSAVAKAEQGHYRSNLDSADYNENIASLQLKVSF